MELIIASRNAGKIREIRRVAEPLGFRVLTWTDFQDWEVPDETGVTLEENAAIKASAISRKYGLPAVADDSGLFVDALGGLPGVESARFAGPEQDADKNIELLLERLKGVPPEERKARFVCVLALAVPGRDVAFARGECPGLITEERRGTQGFGYDPVFQPEGHTRTFAEMDLDEKNSISHRGKALRELEKILVLLLAGT